MNFGNFPDLVVATVTPFKENHPYKDGIIQLVDFLSSEGIESFFVCGTTGEGMLMSLKDRKSAASMFRGATNKSVIVNVSATSYEDTFELCEHSRELGVEGVAVLTPGYYGYSPSEYVSYFSSIARTFDLPLFVYSNPDITNVKLSVKILSSIFEKCSANVVGMKDSSGDIQYLGSLLRALPKEKKVYNGIDSVYLPALSLGAFGQVSGLANVAPAHFVRLRDSWKQGRMDEALNLQNEICAIQSLLGEYPFQGMKEAIKLMGVDVGTPRFPVNELADKSKEELKDSLRRIQLVPA
jgi:dihydrodipicolinate synthase/N-acetylneuraminate lyase